jgi:hypothetical protein
MREWAAKFAAHSHVAIQAFRGFWGLFWSAGGVVSAP